MKFKLLLLSGLCLLLASCAISTTYEYDKTANFPQYKTFSFYKQGIDSLKLNDLDKNVIVTAVANQLQSKGLKEVSNDSNLLVNILASSQKVINVYNDPYWGSPWQGSWQGPWQNPWGYGYGWGTGWAPSWAGSTTVSENRVGEITIHLVDAKKNILVWQGVVDGFTVSNAASQEQQIIKAIQKVFTNYPPK